jgi:hypothetical protein
LPNEWLSKAVRVAMSQADWERFEVLTRSALSESQTPTQARANGLVISRLMETASQAPPAPGPLDWMDWERQKTLRLLRSAV